MKQVGNRRKTNKKSTQFTIDLDIKGLIVVMTLAALTGITLFYLGVIFGKAARDPNQPINAIDSKNDPTKVDVEGLSIPKDLKIYDINDNPKDIDDFTSNIKKELKKTDDIIKSTEKQIIIDEKKNQETEKVNATIKQQTKKWPDQKTVTVKPAGNYTIQVFVTKSKEKASQITQKLRQKSFDAYIDEVSHQNNKLYKIRVGRKTKEEIPELRTRLEKVVGGMGMGLSVVKIK